MTRPVSRSGDHTRLVEAPRVRLIVRKTYTVDWSWLADRIDDETGPDWAEQRHVKTYFSKSAAYRHASWGFILNRRSMNGCSKDECAFGEVGYVNSAGRVDDTRCKYCNPDKSERIGKRLARWMKWRDSLTQEGGSQ